MLKVSVPQDNNKIRKQINALKWQLERDVREKDKLIHQQAIKVLEGKLK